jgi:hypothetical protein
MWPPKLRVSSLVLETLEDLADLRGIGEVELAAESDRGGALVLVVVELEFDTSDVRVGRFGSTCCDSCHGLDGGRSPDAYCAWMA